MRAYGCASGGVIFVPDEIERSTNAAVSCKAQVREEPVVSAAEKKTIGSFFFGRRKKSPQPKKMLEAA